MSGHSFELILAVGAAALAFWIMARFPTAGPKSVFLALGNVVLAYTGGLLVVGPLMDFLHGVQVPGSLALTVVGGALPPLVYLFTSIGWLVRSIQGLFALRH